MRLMSILRTTIEYRVIGGPAMTQKIQRSQNRCPTHPGKFLREIVFTELNKPKTDVARAMGISRQTLYDLLNEAQGVTPEMAVRISVVFGGSPQSWINMQTAHDLWHAERKINQSELTPLHNASA